MKRKLLLLFLSLLFIEVNAQQEIYNFAPGGSGNCIQLNGKIFFTASQPSTGLEVWQSDGTAANTTLVKDIYSGSSNGIARSLALNAAVLNNKLYFLAKDENSLGEIWKTDGTENGTEKITNFINGRVLKLTTVGNVIYFLLKKDNEKLEVWKTDGTTIGTVLIKDNLSIWNSPSFEGKCNNTFIFSFQPPGTNNSRVWRSDGTSEGTFPLIDEYDGNGSGYLDGSGGTSILTQFIEANGKLYFTTRYFLFETDGTLENTKNVARVRSLGNLVHYDDVIVVNNDLYLMFFTVKSYMSNSNNLVILKYNMINKTITTVYEKTTSEYFFASNLVNIGNSLIFTTSNETAGTELVSLNLTDNTIVNIKQLAASNDLTLPVTNLANTNGSIIKINHEESLILSVIDKNYDRKGWVFNSSTQSVQNISALDNIWNPFIYKDYLYYSKENRFWKYTNNLSTIDVTQKKAIVFYPNPSSDVMQLNIDNNNEVENISVFDLNGKLVQTLSNSSQIDISPLPKGIYTAQIKWNGTLINKKIIKN
ncbi:T9SS type A sorting domain-containing protein [Flavobacterium sp.]|uniref:T9SS type A sorting domain-containing protein n=1 Tax=Flavobacterium sp. TaxID=239 RepID=UPI0025BB9B41|nr:T9SS type A sorting domain-containing protein [Flavobacterium sp.]